MALQFTKAWLNTATGDDLLKFFEDQHPSLAHREDYIDAKTFSDRLRQMVKWLSSSITAKVYDRKFVTDAKTRLTTVPGVMSLSFQIGSKSTVYIKSVFCIPDEEYIDDAAIDVFLKYFEIRYGNGGRNLFISQDFLRFSIEAVQREDNRLAGGFGWDWGGKVVSSMAEKAYGIYFERSHWHVLCIDFVAQRVFFGDSLDWGMSIHARKAVIQWLACVSPNDSQSSRPVDRLEGWTIHKLYVPYQGKSSGSCGVIAANTIDCLLDHKIQPWTNRLCVSFRLRLLKMMLGSMPFVSEYLFCHCRSFSGSVSIWREKCCTAFQNTMAHFTFLPYIFLH